MPFDSRVGVFCIPEPTTGLDARAAMTVVSALRKIASSGRSIVCTIHQPSAELFFMFDSLLLLQKGGHQVYFGPIGRRGRNARGAASRCARCVVLLKCMLV